MTGLSSRRVSISRTFFCIYLVVLYLVLSAAPELGNANEGQYKAQRWGVLAQASATSELQVGDLYAVVVGVSKYKDARIPALSVSDKDARSIAELLKTQKNLFKDIHVSLLVNEDATEEALKDEFIYKLRKAGKDDTVIIFLSGHGVDDPKSPGEFFFLPYDANSEKVALRGIHMNRQWFTDRYDSKRVLIIADACHAGGFAGRGAKRLPPSLDKLMSQFKESEGRVFISSSRADELSNESPEFGHSLFTHFLLEGLSGKAADQEGVVSLKALYDYVYKTTKKASDGFQSPQMEPKQVGKFPLALVYASIDPVPPAVHQQPSPSATAQPSLQTLGVHTPDYYEIESSIRSSDDTEKALQKYEEALGALGTGESEKEKTITLNNIGRIYLFRGQYAKALQYFEKSQAIRQDIGDVAGEGITLNNLDDSEALNWFKKDADGGNAFAQISLGFMYAEGRGVSKDYSEAVKWYQKAADQGHATAQNNLGILYANGQGVEKDDAEAVKLYKKAAEQGYAGAQANLGFMYTKGRGVAKNAREAVKWYRKAADQGIVSAQLNLGHCYRKGEGVPKDPGEAVNWYKKVSDQGDVNAQYLLGVMYRIGSGVSKDDQEAATWFSRAAEQGHAVAQNDLGFCYATGYGVTKDDQEALKWYKKSAEQGYATAQANLGLRYLNGQGVSKDESEAYKWIRKSADQDNLAGQNGLGLLYENGKGVIKDHSEAVGWYRKAAENGNTAAMTNLGNMHLWGHGVPKNRYEGIKWLKKAAEKGDKKAKDKLRELGVNS